MFELTEVRYKHILQLDKLLIKQGKVTCIVGESGSGKTTLIRLLNKLISCDSGEILYNGQNIDTINSVELRSSVVMLPQIPTIFTGNLKENLLIGLKFSKKKIADDQTLFDVLKLVNLNKQLDDACTTLSVGEKQRLALARVILLNPDVFLLDEPSAALDEETEKIVIEKLVTYSKQENKTLIIVTHSMNIAQTYSDEIINVHQGKVIEIRGQTHE